MSKQLSDGLILRSLAEGTPQDKANLPQFFIDVFTGDYGPEDAILGIWAKDLLADQHPTVTDEDVWVIVDPAHDDQIVSGLLLIPQVWRYEDIELPVGRVEIVATRPEYRNRGLIRELFAALHARSESLGHNIQAITGIPYFYRQFGYAMAVDLGASTTVPFAALPKLAEDETPQFTLRLATTADIPKLMAWQQYFASKHLLSVVRTSEIWEYELTTRNPKSHTADLYHIIVDREGTEVGYVSTDALGKFGRIRCVDYAVGPESSHLQTFEDVLRGMRDFALEHFKEDTPYFIRFDSGLYSTLYPLLKSVDQANMRQTTYAWYLRVVDIAKFIRDVQPILEKRLVGSRANNFTGQIHISFYSKNGLFLRFEKGCIVEVNNSAPPFDKEDAAFPFHTFLNVVFGHKTIDELKAILPDVFANRKAAALLDAMFPAKPSWVIGLV